MGANAKGVQTLTKCKTQDPKIKVSVMLLCPLLEVVFRQERETRYRDCSGLVPKSLIPWD